MTAKTIVTILLLLPFIYVNAQDVLSSDISKRPVAFESVSFSTVQGSIIITCKNADQLTDFEFVGEGSHLTFAWDSKNPADRFPMKLGLKPGKVTVKYKMRGGQYQIIELVLAEKEEVKLAL